MLKNFLEAYYCWKRWWLLNDIAVAAVLIKKLQAARTVNTEIGRNGPFDEHTYWYCSDADTYERREIEIQQEKIEKWKKAVEVIDTKLKSYV